MNRHTCSNMPTSTRERAEQTHLHEMRRRQLWIELQCELNSLQSPLKIVSFAIKLGQAQVDGTPSVPHRPYRHGGPERPLVLSLHRKRSLPAVLRRRWLRDRIVHLRQLQPCRSGDALISRARGVVSCCDDVLVVTNRFLQPAGVAAPSCLVEETESPVFIPIVAVSSEEYSR